MCVCVCFWEVYCMCARVGGLVGWLGGWAVGRSGRGEREDCRGVVTWVAPLQLGERERQAEETRLRGDGTGAQLHFPFCRISTVASFFSVSFHSTEWVKERERAIEREWKRKSSQFFLKTRSWLSYKQMLPVIWSLSRHIDRTILRFYWLAFSYLWFYYKENRSLINMGMIFSQSVVFFYNVFFPRLISSICSFLFFLVAHLCFGLSWATADVLHTFCQCCKYSEHSETFWKQ